MKKHIITAAMVTACLALCAAVWPQTETVEETPATIQGTVVSAPAPTDENTEAEIGTTPLTEEEKAEIPQTEPLHENIPKPEPAPEKVSEIAEVLPALEAEPELEPVSAPEPTSVPALSKSVTEPQCGDIVYVPGFGWLESQGPGEVIHDESIYENGNKIGVMG